MVHSTTPWKSSWNKDSRQEQNMDYYNYDMWVSSLISVIDLLSANVQACRSLYIGLLCTVIILWGAVTSWFCCPCCPGAKYIEEKEARYDNHNIKLLGKCSQHFLTAFILTNRLSRWFSNRYGVYETPNQRRTRESRIARQLSRLILRPSLSQTLRGSGLAWRGLDFSYVKVNRVLF